MSRLPTVAIIGRPNTGKSTLFNRIVGSRRAIVSDVPGTTRDHVVQKVETEELDYLLLDTGGIGGGSEDHDFEDDVTAQSKIALEAADLILLTINAQEELTSSDFSVVELLRKNKRRHVPVVIIATKCDRPGQLEEKIPSYYELNIGEKIIGISAVHNIGTDELEETIIEELKKLHFIKAEKVDIAALPTPRIAIVGKPNVGKSSLINALMSAPEREVNPRLVSDIPGTTRDSSDTIVMHENEEYIFVDTAGLRRKSNVDGHLEYISALRSLRAVEESDVTVLVLDASEVISRQEKRIAALASEEGKGLILLLNKADLLKTEERAEKELEVRAALSFCKFAPILFCSANTREGVLKIFPHIQAAVRNRSRRLHTKDLMRWFEDIVPRIPSTQLRKCKFITQAEELPPTFVLFVSKPRDVDGSHLRALENNLRQTFAFEGTPIRIITKEK